MMNWFNSFPNKKNVGPYYPHFLGTSKLVVGNFWSSKLYSQYHSIYFRLRFNSRLCSIPLELRIALADCFDFWPHKRSPPSADVLHRDRHWHSAHRWPMLHLTVWSDTGQELRSLKYELRTVDNNIRSIKWRESRSILVYTSTYIPFRFWSYRYIVLLYFMQHNIIV